MHLIIETYPCMGSTILTWRCVEGTSVLRPTRDVVIPVDMERTPIDKLLAAVAQELWLDAERVQDLPF